MKDIIIADFDGTLAPIRLKPHQVKLSQAMLKTLEKMHKNNITKIILSSRNLKFLKSRLPKFVKIIGSRGNTSLKIKKTQLNKIYKQLTLSLKYLEVKIKIKKIGVVVHYRTLGKSKVKSLEKSIKTYCALFNYKCIRGRKAMEITPKQIQDKIEVIKKITTKHKVVFFGDDDSDATAAREVIKKGGVAYLIKTKERKFTPNGAKQLNGITEVRKTLEDLIS